VLLQEYHADSTLNISTLSEFQVIRFSLELARENPCQSFFEVILCFFEFPPCSVQLELLPICLDRCPEIQKAHNYCFQGRNLEITDPDRYPVFKNIYLFIENFTCSAPETYYFSDDGTHVISNTSCSKLIYSYSLFIHVCTVLYMSCIYLICYCLNISLFSQHSHKMLAKTVCKLLIYLYNRTDIS